MGKNKIYKFLDSNNNIDYTKFKEIAQIPKPKTYSDFRKNLLQSPNCICISGNHKIIYQTIVGEVQIYIPYAYGHFHKYGKYGNNKEERNSLTGSLNLLFDKPVFVFKDIQNTLYFYKPFKSQNGYKDIISIFIEKSKRLEYRTTYEDKYNQIDDLIHNQKLVYVEN